MHRGSVVSLDLIVEELWGDESPATARHMVAVYVSRLRKTLGEDIVVTRRPGYLLQVGSDQVDAIASSTCSRREGKRSRRGRRLGRCSPGRGACPLARAGARRLRLRAFAQAEIARLEELRLQAEEERIEAELALGNGAELVAELETLVAMAPLRERRAAQHMLALYRSGQQADALSAYQEARRAFVDELGIEPGPDLRELERRILEQDEGLLEPGPSSSPAVPPAGPEER